MRLTIVLSNVRGGGSVWSAVQWANVWAARGDTVSIITLFPSMGEGAYFQMHKNITWVRLDIDDRPTSSRLMAAWRILRGLFLVRRAVSRTRPDLVLAFDGPVNTRTLMACLGLRVPLVVMEQAHPGYYHFGAFWERWRDRLYPRAAAVANLTRAAGEWCAERFGPGLYPVIHNPVYPVSLRAELDHPGPYRIITGARMVEQKRLDLLIEAFFRVAGKHPQWSLVIYGDGPLRPELEQMVAEKGLRERVHMPGWTARMSEEMANSDLFALSSAYEGFGNVIAESLAVGVPVVSFDCPSGPGDIIRHGVDGLLARPMDPQDLADCLDRVMGDKDLRLRMGARAVEVLERFPMSRTLELWDDLFARLHMGKGSGKGEGTVKRSPKDLLRDLLKGIGRLHDRLYGALCGWPPFLRPLHFQWLSIHHLNNELVRVLPGLEGTVLDLGCGLKPYRKLMARAAGYTGADIEPKPGLDVLLVPGGPLPFADASFDVLLCTQVLEHVADLEGLCAEMRRVLRPGGMLVASVPFIYQVHGSPHDYRRFTEYGLTAALTGFQVESLNRQGGIGSSLGILLLNWLDQQLGSNVATWALKIVCLPLWVLFSLAVNLVASVVDRLDTTAVFYHNLLVVARRDRQPAEPSSAPVSAAD